MENLARSKVFYFLTRLKILEFGEEVDGVGGLVVMLRRLKSKLLLLGLLLFFVLVFRLYFTKTLEFNERRELRNSYVYVADVTVETSTFDVVGGVTVESRNMSRAVVHSPKSVQDISSDKLNEGCDIVFDFKNETRMLMVPQEKVEANCPLLLKGNPGYARSIRRKMKNWTNVISDTAFMNSLTLNCSHTRRDFTNSFYVSKQEKEFPLAFEVLVYYKPSRIQQYIRLLKNIYRPQNLYCIHIDIKAPDWWTNMLITFASCFPNVIIAKHRVKVDYGTSKILYAHFRCFNDLLEAQHSWKYVISLHGTELPLVTNREMVEILWKMNGTNLIQKGEDSSKESAQSHAWTLYKAVPVNDGKKVVLTNETLGPIPYNITIFKSAASANSAFSRQFISFIFSDKRSIALADFLKDVQSAVEMFFSTVNSFPDAPGGYHTFHGNVSDIPLVAKRDWVFKRKTFKKYCFARKLVHNICIVSSSDLARLREVSETKGWWFHNKYFIDYDHVVMNCMENLLLRRNADEYQRDCL